MLFFISCEQGHNGEIYLIIILLGRLFITILGSGKDGTIECLNTNMNKLERKRQEKKRNDKFVMY